MFLFLFVLARGIGCFIGSLNDQSFRIGTNLDFMNIGASVAAGISVLAGGRGCPQLNMVEQVSRDDHKMSLA